MHALVPFEELYRRNGLQHLPFTTLYQLATERGLDAAEAALLIPDLLAFLLTGAEVAERTNASTTGLLDARSGEWDLDLVERLGIPPSLLPRLVDPGAVIGSCRGTPPPSSVPRSTWSRSVRTTPPRPSWPRRCRRPTPPTSPAGPGAWSAWSSTSRS